MTARQTLTVYSRRGCHLCEDLLGELEPLLRQRAHLAVVDVDTDESLRERYGVLVPVVCADEQELCRYHLDRPAVLAWLESHSGSESDHS
ncbi:MAG: glutaredoxin family protein [Gammaproteobacteria bacterium]